MTSLIRRMTAEIQSSKETTKSPRRRSTNKSRMKTPGSSKNTSMASGTKHHLLRRSLETTARKTTWTCPTCLNLKSLKLPNPRATGPEATPESRHCQTLRSMSLIMTQSKSAMLGSLASDRSCIGRTRLTASSGCRTSPTMSCQRSTRTSRGPDSPLMRRSRTRRT